MKAILHNGKCKLQKSKFRFWLPDSLIILHFSIYILQFALEER
jgi:hypothetical protein